ncbi:MAG: putative maltokinase, partial [Longimicrobiales bacterium]
DNIYLGDRNGVRTPMQWSADRNGGFSRTNPQRLYLPVITDPEYHYESVNVEAQENNPSSLLWWMRRLIGLRKRYRAFGRGGIRFLAPANRKVLAFVREHEDERILVIVNLSRFTQFVDLDLAEFEGQAMIELFGQTQFPEITQRPYFLTLGPHTFHWFELRSEEALRDSAHVDPLAVRETELGVPSGDWRAILRGRESARLEALLPRYMRTTRWFRGKARPIRGAHIDDVIPIPGDGDQAVFVLATIDFLDGERDTYVLPLAYAPPGRAKALAESAPRALVARLRLRGEDEPGALYDALYEDAVASALLEALASRRVLQGERGAIEATSLDGIVSAEEMSYLGPRVLGAEQSNTSVAYGSRWVLKLFRRLEDGVSLELELGRHLTRIGFEGAPAVGGALEYRREGEPRTLGVLNRYVENEGDAWTFTIDELGGFLERALASPVSAPAVDVTTRGLLDHAALEPPDEVEQRVGAYLDLARSLGRRTAELHVALAAETEDASFVPEPFNPFYRRSLYQSMRNQTGQVLQTLSTHLDALPDGVRAEARALVGAEERLLARFRRLVDDRPEARRIRTHGDYHLGQVLYTGKDFIITDFEGEPARPLSERRIKRSALRDVAGMLRSFDYAAYTAGLEAERSGLVGEDGRALLEPWLKFWYAWVGGAFLRGYLEHANGGFVPSDSHSLEILLDAYLLEKALYEVGYELNNRPDWIEIPIRAVLEMLRDGAVDERF